MANYKIMEQLKRGFTLFTSNDRQTSYPAQTFATPGIYAKSLYSRYVPLRNAGFDDKSPFCSKKTLDGTLDHAAKELTYAKLDVTKTIISQQIGHGQDGGEDRLEQPPSPYNETKMQKVLEKMRHPVYNVEVVPNIDLNNDLKPDLKKESKKRKSTTKSESDKAPKYWKFS